MLKCFIYKTIYCTLLKVYIISLYYKFTIYITFIYYLHINIITINANK